MIIVSHTISNLFKTNKVTTLLKHIKSTIITSLVTLLLGLSSLFPHQTLATTSSIDTSALVGSTAGALSVEQGAANYTIPITVPSGTSGMKPELSINYNSNSGNGLLGMGFSLGGLSTIHRCSKTIVTDGVKGGVNYDDNDRYCLDGQRLVVISGQDGQAGSEYRTEIDTFSRVKFTGNHWSVETKSGQTFEYGNTQDSKIEAQGKTVIRLWAVNKITDASGNSVDYVYTEDNDTGEYLIDSINYANNSIAFTYSARGEAGYDDATFYEGGGLISRTKLLTKIVTYSDNNLIRDYNLEYLHTAEEGDWVGIRRYEYRSRLVAIQQCAGGQCLPKTKFEWQVGKVQFVNASNTNHEPPQPIVDSENRDNGVRLVDINGNGFSDFVYSNGSDREVYLNTGSAWQQVTNYQINEPIVDSDGRDKGVRFLDINGDGLMDYLRGDTDDNYKKVYLNTGNAWQESSSFVLPHYVVNDYDYTSSYQYQDCGWYKWRYSCSWHTSSPKQETKHNVSSGLLFVELNGDGLIDIVYGKDGTRKAYINSGTNWVESTTFSFNFDIMSNSTETNLPYVRSPVEVVDINGDGLSDITSVVNDNRQTYINTGSSWELDDSYALPDTILDNSKYHSSIILKDLNADGLTDIAYATISKKVKVYLNSGDSWINVDNITNKGFFSDVSFLLSDIYRDYGAHLVDFNNDGLIDLTSNVYAISSANAVAVNDGRDFFAGLGFCSDGTISCYFDEDGNLNPPENAKGSLIPRFVTSENKDAGVRFADLDGDGFIDVIQGYGDEKKALYNQYQHPLITSITDGFDIKTEISYASMTDTSVRLSDDSTVSYPTIKTTDARQVVKSVTTDNAVDATNTTSYFYKGAKHHLQGRGSLGFEVVIAVNQATGINEYTWYKQQFPFIGSAYRTTKLMASDNTIISKQEKTFASSNLTNSKVYLSYVNTDTTYTYKLDGSNVSASQTTNSQLDAYGNIGSVVVNHYEYAGGWSNNFRTTTNSTYNNDVTNWHLGRLTGSTVNHLSATNPITKTSSFTYNSNGLLQSETIEPNTNKSLVTTYEYDSFGNKTKSTTTGGSIVSRSTTVEYSADGKFPVKTTNALGHSETKTFDTKTGNVLTLTGPNGLTTTWEYDALGRQAKETRADGTMTTTSYAWAIDDNNNEAPNSIYKVTTLTSGSSPKTTYFDAFNRKVREQHTGFDGRKVNSDTYYDNLGRVERASLPYFEDEQGHFVTTQYDAIGRLISTTKPADYGNTATSSASYNGLSTTTTNALGHTKTTTKNNIGKIIRIDEPEGAWLTHHHDSIGNLIKTNVGGVITTMEYDIRGNKTKMNDPDMGTWTYTYNALGELTSQTDAKGQTSTMAYDKLGRMSQRAEAEGTSTWTYDTKSNGIGKLSSVNGPNGYKKELSYDALGRVSSTTLTANGETLTTTNSYDPYSRLNIQTRPQNFKVENVYNQYGYLMAKRAPKAQITDYDWGHLKGLLEQGIENAQEALEKAQALEKKASIYKLTADSWSYMHRYVYSRELYTAERAFSNKSLEYISQLLQQKATQYRNLANGYMLGVSRFLELAAMNVPEDQKRQKYYTTSTSSDVGNYSAMSFFRYENGVKESYGDLGVSTRYRTKTWCKSKQWCEVLSEVSAIKSEMFAQESQHRVIQAELFLNAQGSEKQTLVNQLIEYYRAKNNNALTMSQNYLTQAEDSIQEANHWRQVAENSQGSIKDDNRDHYQAMLDDTDNVYFYRIKSRDAAGRLTGHIVGNGLSTEQDYSPASGHLYTIKSGFRATDEIRNLEYEYDLMDNVTQRQNHISSLSESFSYDALDRLTQSNTTGKIGDIDYGYGVSYQYDINGNITNKSDIGDYNYNPVDSTRPHTPSSITGVNTNANNGDRTYTYDANGNMTQNGDKSITWTSHNKPKRFTKGGDSTTFTYAPDRSRYKKVQTRSSDSTTITTKYFGKVYEQIKQNNNTEHKHFIYLDKQLIAIHIKTDTTTSTPIPDKTRYLHYDNLGSIDTITDGQGNIVERMSYTAFGDRRQGDWRASNPLLPIIPALTNRGFTGHEHIDEMGLIHMNGRVYDPQIGRFLSADPHIQAPYNTQSYNRYSYTLNNPLKYTDPSGHFWWFVAAAVAADQVVNDGKLTKTIIVTAIAAYTGYVASESFLWGSLGAGSSVATSTLITQSAIIGGAVGGATFGATNTLLHGGSLSQAFDNGLKGAFAGAVTGGVTGYYDGVWSAQRVAASAFGGGISSEVMGGDFKDGFNAAFITSSMRYLYAEVSSINNYNPTGEPHLRQRGINDVGGQLTDKKLALFKSGKLGALETLMSDQSSFMKAVGRKPFFDAFGEFHDGFHDLPYVPGNQLALIVTMPHSYAVTVGAYLQPYTNYYIMDRNIKRRYQ